MKKKLFCFGMGYVASFFSEKLASIGWSISTTCRLKEKQVQLKKKGFDAFLISSNSFVSNLEKILEDVTHILVSIPPYDDGDPVIKHYKKQVSSMKNLEWIAYLSSTGVYGNHNGEWINEKTKPLPTNTRGKRRLLAEKQWLDAFENHNISMNIFRLSAIYGPGRNSFLRIKEGREKRIIKKNLFFSRIHVEDVIGYLYESAKTMKVGGLYNVADDEPAPPQDITTYACNLLGVTPPPIEIYNEKIFSNKQGNFYLDSKKVSNRRIKEVLEYQLKYKSYRDGLKSILYG